MSSQHARRRLGQMVHAYSTHTRLQSAALARIMAWACSIYFLQSVRGTDQCHAFVCGFTLPLPLRRTRQLGDRAWEGLSTAGCSATRIEQSLPETIDFVQIWLFQAGVSSSSGRPIGRICCRSSSPLYTLLLRVPAYRSRVVKMAPALRAFGVPMHPVVSARGL